LNFASWLLNQRYRTDLVGDFADQVARRNWVHTEDLQVLRVRLTLEKASQIAFSALYLAFEEWVEFKDLPELTVFPVRIMPRN
jgi:hypothetical protein